MCLVTKFTMNFRAKRTTVELTYKYWLNLYNEWISFSNVRRPICKLHVHVIRKNAQFLNAVRHASSRVKPEFCHENFDAVILVKPLSISPRHPRSTNHFQAAQDMKSMLLTLALMACALSMDLSGKKALWDGGSLWKNMNLFYLMMKRYARLSLAVCTVYFRPCPRHGKLQDRNL